MKPTIKHFEKKTVLGTQSNFISAARMEADGAVLIPTHWMEFNERRAELNSVVNPKTSYGIILPKRVGQEDGMIYMSCVEVSDASHPPVGMKSLSIPAGNYAVFTYQGHISGVGEIMDEIYETWIPANEEKLRPAAHLEIYDERFDPTSVSSIVEIWVAVK